MTVRTRNRTEQAPSRRSALKGLDNLMSPGQPSTPDRKGRGSIAVTPTLVTPSKALTDEESPGSEESNGHAIISRSVSRSPSNSSSSENEVEPEPKSKRNLFGRSTSNNEVVAPPSTVLPHTRQMYKIVNKMTGSIGGNGCGGAIYGELTIGSMQKIVDLMKVHTKFGPNSRFVDVGSGLGKPNLHVAQDPGCEFSYGIEMEHVRWMLGMTNLQKVLEQQVKKPVDEFGHRCFFKYGDITEANYFDPFTHVYMFDIGFPPKLFLTLAKMFNESHSPYLICYHGPKLMIERYGFNVELIIQSTTSMHGSSENHMGYIYKRVGLKDDDKDDDDFYRKITSSRVKGRVMLEGGIPCDPLFVDAWKSTRRDIKPFFEDVKSEVVSNLSSQRSRRRRKPVTKYDPSNM